MLASAEHSLWNWGDPGPVGWEQAGWASRFHKSPAMSSEGSQAQRQESPISSHARNVKNETVRAKGKIEITRGWGQWGQTELGLIGAQYKYTEPH
jgi:hypothetical protein